MGDIDTAVGAGYFTTLVVAVQAAGLVDRLNGKGLFTVLRLMMKLSPLT